MRPLSPACDVSTAVKLLSNAYDLRYEVAQ